MNGERDGCAKGEEEDHGVWRIAMMRDPGIGS